MNDSTWPWMSGDPVPNVQGVYGERGNPSTENKLGARRASVGWYDSVNEEFWLFGGNGYGQTVYGTYQYLSFEVQWLS
jgi:hypothetical protein